LNVKDLYSKYAIKIWKQDKYDWRKREDIERIKSPLDFGRKGEAAKRLSKEIKEKHPEIPWKDMAGMRDKRNYKRIRNELQLWILKNVQITRYTFRCFVKCRLKKDCLKHLSCLNLPGSFLFMGYTRGSQILVMKNLKKYFWSVWINVTTGIIKKGYSST